MEVRQNGLRLTASGAPGSDAAAMRSHTSSRELRRYCIARKERSSQFLWIFNDRFRCEQIQLSDGADAGLFCSFLGERRAEIRPTSDVVLAASIGFCCVNNQKALTTRLRSKHSEEF